jgi:MFS family permease
VAYPRARPFATAAPARTDLRPRRFILALQFSISLMMIVSIMSNQSITIALPVLGRELGIDRTDLQWPVTVASLSCLVLDLRTRAPLSDATARILRALQTVIRLGLCASAALRAEVSPSTPTEPPPRLAHAQGCLLLLLGRLADIFGRKPMFLAGCVRQRALPSHTNNGPVTNASPVP